jgi:hypothetical protein
MVINLFRIIFTTVNIFNRGGSHRPGFRNPVCQKKGSNWLKIKKEKEHQDIEDNLE